jgi:hypothetical protein
MRTEVRAVIFSIALLALTAVHHAYGAVVYATPWRMHVAEYAAITAMLIGGLSYVDWKNRGHALGTVAHRAAMISSAIPIAFLGLFEGAYNHILKNVVYFAGLPMRPFRELFPAPTYELPNDVIFEVTGCAHFPLALVAAFTLAAAIRWRDR